ncbi:hypothetical protein EES44_18315 [Streptomyces sp. ADI96-15]|nr:hypothetical protein EES44_18315 [Streptomyces sp. ADI96-15]
MSGVDGGERLRPFHGRALGEGLAERGEQASRPSVVAAQGSRHHGLVTGLLKGVLHSSGQHRVRAALHERPRTRRG